MRYSASIETRSVKLSSTIDERALRNFFPKQSDAHAEVRLQSERKTVESSIPGIPSSDLPSSRDVERRTMNTHYQPSQTRMKNLFEAQRIAEIKQRLPNLKADSERQWGKMNAQQMLAHCAMGIELALGDHRPPRMLIGRVLGRIIKPMALGNDAPMRKNSPTVPGFVVADRRDLNAERARLYLSIDRFAAAGPAGCTTHAHSFFGKLTPDEWAILMYKHLDHHLRQFGV